MTSQWVGTSNFGQQRHQAVQHLGDAAADRGGVDHLDRLALQIAGPESEVHRSAACADDALVVVEMRRRRRALAAYHTCGRGSTHARVPGRAGSGASGAAAGGDWLSRLRVDELSDWDL